jgi:hypothetical protein
MECDINSEKYHLERTAEVDERRRRNQRSAIQPRVMLAAAIGADMRAQLRHISGARGQDLHLMSYDRSSFIPQRHNRILPGGAAGGVKTENNPHHTGQTSFRLIIKQFLECRAIGMRVESFIPGAAWRFDRSIDFHAA